MPVSDLEKWNDRYREGRYAAFQEPRSFLVRHAADLPPAGLALDAAMGMGSNAGFLIERGWQVVGVDISSVALQQARARYPALMAVQADLTAFYLPENKFDLILNFYYLQRDLWQPYERALKPGGMLFFETMTIDMLSQQPDTDPAYLLAHNELRSAFPDLEVLEYQEGWELSDHGHRRPVARFLGRKP